MRVKVLVLMIIACSALSGCKGLHMLIGHGGPQVKGSGKSTTQTRSVGGFKGIEVRGAADCDVTVGPATKVQVTTDDNLQSHVTLKVESGKLIVETKGNYS